MENLLQQYCSPVIFVTCLCVGYIVKKWIKDVDNKFIPTICGVLGVAMSIYIHWGEIDAQTLVLGLVSGLASTGFHQIFKQIIENGGELFEDITGGGKSV